MPVDLVVATHNAHKTAEIAEMAAGVARVVDLTAYPEIPPAVEDGSTFEENATIKAVAASGALPPGTLVIADDSGLEVDALGGAPGVFSARYSGEGATDASNRDKLLRELDATGARGKARAARFRCCIVAAAGGEKLAAFDGAVEGVIGTAERGAGGFGYDPLFIPAGHCETFAELPADAKNSISHRSRALAPFLGWLRGRQGASD